MLWYSQPKRNPLTLILLSTHQRLFYLWIVRKVMLTLNFTRQKTWCTKDLNTRSVSRIQKTSNCKGISQPKTWKFWTLRYRNAEAMIKCARQRKKSIVSWITIFTSGHTPTIRNTVHNNMARRLLRTIRKKKYLASHHQYQLASKWWIFNWTRYNLKKTYLD